MRLQLIGRYSLEEFQKAIAAIIDDLKANDIDSLKNVNVYAGLCIMGEEVRVVENGREVEHIVYDLGRRQQISLAAAKLRGQTPESISKLDGEE